MKRWYCFIESFPPKIIYKFGTTNVVADALSNSDLEQSNSDKNTQHSAESSFENVINQINNCYQQRGGIPYMSHLMFLIRHDI